MNKFLVFLIFFLAGRSLHAQCLSGDCKNGVGKMDMGYAVYEGNFKDGKPNGPGIMDYGGGEKYVGQFAGGTEEGEGILYKGGKQTPVLYRRGVLQVYQKSVVIGGNESTEKVPGCLTGNCRNGYGEIVFPSGNRYKGNFKNNRFSGSGEMQFAGGNIIKATFEESIPTVGTFYYAAEKTLFKGTFKEDGTPRSGVYESAALDGKVTVTEGRIVEVKHPVSDSLRADHIANFETCPVCQGKGKADYATPYRDVETRECYSAVKGFGTETTTRTGYTFATQTCVNCMGTGESRKKKGSRRY